MGKKNQLEYKQWMGDEGVLYILDKDYVTISAGGYRVGPIRLIGNNLDTTIRQGCREIGFEINNSN